jgi:hypothetical protein
LIVDTEQGAKRAGTLTLTAPRTKATGVKKAHEMIGYACWIAEQRAAALARGGKVLRGHSHMSRRGEADFFGLVQVQRGEIINPLTGEIVTGCLSIRLFAKDLGISSHALGKLMQKMACADLVLCTREVPLIGSPERTRPLYYRTPQASTRGIEEGWVIPVTGSRGRPFILITPLGQEKIKAELAVQTPACGRIAAKRQKVRALLNNGLSQAEISRRTGIPKQTVSRIVRTLS